MVVDAAAGDNLLEVAHNAGVEIHHACDGSCACTTCHYNNIGGSNRASFYYDMNYQTASEFNTSTVS